MNIEQIKTDMTNGVMVSRFTVAKLVEAALMMQEALEEAGYHKTLQAVEAL